MSNYLKTTNFTAKDSLTSGDPAKKIVGSEFDTEFDALQVAIASKADASELNNISSLNTTNYSILESGGYLVIKYGTATIARIDSSGNLTVSGDITAFGSL